MGLKERLHFRVVSFFKNGALEREMDEEMQAHFDQLVDDFKALGYEEPEAKRMANREFGNIDRVKEECRDNWGIRFVFDSWRDLCFGLRNAALKRTKSSAVIAITLSLCLGWLISVYSLFESTFYRELPVEDPDRVVRVLSEATNGAFSYLNAVDYIKESQSFESLSAYLHFTELIWHRDEETTVLNSSFVSENFFETLAQTMHLGSDLSEGSEDVAIISHTLWKTQFGAKQDTIGESVILNGKPLTVVGVAPETFLGIRKGRETDIWIPVSNLKIALPGYFTSNRGHIGFRLIGRLKEGISTNQAEQELETIAQNMEVLYPNHAYNIPKLIRISSESKYLKNSRPERHRLYLLILIVSIALLTIACCNICNVLISGILERQAEFTIRLSLGAPPTSIFRLLFWENLMLVLAGGLGGVVLLVFFLRFGTPLIGLDQVTPNYNAFILLSLLLLLIVLVFTTVSLPYSRNKDLVSSVKRSITGAPKSKTKRALLLMQVALSSALLIYSLFSVQSLRNAWALNPGHATENIVLARLYLKATGWKADEAWAYYWNLKEHLESLPEVEVIGIGGSLPLSGTGRVEISTENVNQDSNGKIFANQTRIGPDFFEAMGVHLLQGECTNRNDHFQTELPKHHSGPLPIVINKSFAQHFFPSEDPINKIIYKGHYRRDLLIKGVVSDFKTELHTPPQPGFFIPYDYNATKNRFLVWHIKTTNNRPETIKRIQDTISSFNDTIPIIQFGTIEDHLKHEFESIRAGSTTSSGLAIIGVFLSALGIWAMLRTEIDSRKREIAIRMALGCKIWKLFTLLSKDVARTISIGVGTGIILAIFAVHYSQGVLFQADPLNVLIYTLALALIAITTLLSAAGPMFKLAQGSPATFANGEN